MAHIISIANQKGGVGKTTTSIEIATCISKMRKKVLLIDFDQQSNLSTYMNAESDNSIYDIMNGKILIEEAIVKSNKIDVIPGSEALSKADKEFTGPKDIYILSDICEELGDDYDYILIDTNPSRNILLTMAYIASDYIVIPTECDEGSLRGITAVERDLSILREGRHPISKAKIISIILNKYENTQMHKAALEQIEEFAAEIDKNILVTTVRKSIKASEAKTMQKSLQEYAKNQTLSLDYKATAKQLVKKLEGK